jgi:hypothetical protein
MGQAITEAEQRTADLYTLLELLLEQMDWERVCAEHGWEVRPLTYRHADIELKARAECVQSVTWWEHASPTEAHRLAGGTEPVRIERRWGIAPKVDPGQEEED